MAAAAVIGRGGAVPDRALAWSLLGHGALALLVLLGGIVIHRAPPHTQLAIKATVVDARQLREPRPAPSPPQKTEPRPEPVPAPVPEADRRLKEQQAEKERRAEQQKRELAAQREKELQAKQRAEKAKADLAEKQRQEKAAAERARQAKAKAEADRAKAEAEKIRAAREKEEAARRAAAEAASKRDMARQLEEEERLLAAADSGALAAYLALIRQKVERHWVRPPSAGAGLECEVLVTQIPGGTVAGVRMGNCNGDDAVRRSIEAAVLRASPLPLPDDPRLFERNLRFTFKPEQ